MAEKTGCGCGLIYYVFWNANPKICYIDFWVFFDCTFLDNFICWIQEIAISIFRRFLMNPVAKGSTISPSDEIYKPISDVMNGQFTVSQWASNLNSIYKQIRDELASQTSST
jgi:hypothetical protein